MMNALSVTESLPHFLASLPLDDSTLCVLVALLGIIAGCFFANYHEQLKAKRAKVARRNALRRRVVGK
jgi:hypothetical protein